MCGDRQRIVDQAKARGNARDTGVVPGRRTSSEGAKFHHCRRSEDDIATTELWATSVLTMGKPIDANEVPDCSACRANHSPFVARNLHGQVADALTAFMHSSSSCYHLDPDVF